MAASLKQKQTKQAPSTKKPRVVESNDSVRKKAALRPIAHETSDEFTPLDWRDEQQVRPRVGDGIASEQWKEELQLTEYIESRALKWIKELEQIGDLALLPHGDLPPDYELAAKIRLGLVKLSSVSRQRVDLTAQIAMSSGPDLSQLSDQELKAIELASPEQLNELARRIGKLKAVEP